MTETVCLLTQFSITLCQEVALCCSAPPEAFILLLFALYELAGCFTLCLLWAAVWYTVYTVDMYKPCIFTTPAQFPLKKGVFKWYICSQINEYFYVSSPPNCMLRYCEAEFNNKLVEFNINNKHKVEFVCGPFQIRNHLCLILLAFHVLFSFWRFWVIF